MENAEATWTVRATHSAITTIPTIRTEDVVVILRVVSSVVTMDSPAPMGGPVTSTVAIALKAAKAAAAAVAVAVAAAVAAAVDGKSILPADNQI